MTREVGAVSVKALSRRLFAVCQRRVLQCVRLVLTSGEVADGAKHLIGNPSVSTHGSTLDDKHLVCELEIV
jgi:hypothetical protein